jgi:PPOX class probable F420-dependent enzyme
MSMVLNDTIRAALTSGKLAHLVTLNPDESPRVTLVWIGLDADEIVCAHLGRRQNVRNIEKDARVALSLETGGQTRDLDIYLVIFGRARITEGGAPGLLQRLAHVYTVPSARFPPMDNPPPGYVTHIVPESVGGLGP